MGASISEVIPGVQGGLLLVTKKLLKGLDPELQNRQLVVRAASNEKMWEAAAGELKVRPLPPCSTCSPRPVGSHLVCPWGHLATVSALVAQLNCYFWGSGGELDNPQWGGGEQGVGAVSTLAQPEQEPHVLEFLPLCLCLSVPRCHYLAGDFHVKAGEAERELDLENPDRCEGDDFQRDAGG